MSRYYRIPRWWRWFYPEAIWDFSNSAGAISKKGEPQLYLSFDDGPDPEITPWLLNLLNVYQAKATFFCLGNQAVAFPELMDQIQAAGHSIGNHSQNHLNGWKTNTKTYLEDVKAASDTTSSSLFRPPYGRIRPGQFRRLKQAEYRIIFWGHLSYDFDASLSSEERYQRILNATKPGQIFVFHENKKAFPQLQKELPKLLDQWQSDGYIFSAVKGEIL